MDADNDDDDNDDDDDDGTICLFVFSHIHASSPECIFAFMALASNILQLMIYLYNVMLYLVCR